MRYPAFWPNSLREQVKDIIVEGQLMDASDGLEADD